VNKLGPPPREIPAGVRLRILARHDVAATLWFTLPAAAMLALGVLANPPSGARMGLVIVACILLLLALKYAISRLLKVSATLRRMSQGQSATGRIVACRFEWDAKRREMPYREFLQDWVTNLARSQMGKFTGCLIKAFAIPFVLGFVLMIVTVALVLAWRQFGTGGGAEIQDGLDWTYLAKFVGSFLLFVVIAGGYIWFWRRAIDRGTVAFVDKNREELMQSAEGKAAYERHILEEAAKPESAIHLREPLPVDSSSSPELICRVEYSHMGQVTTATGRARLCNRLRMTGVEDLIYDPLRPAEVELLVGLPDEVAVAANGQWHDISSTGHVVGLSFAAGMMAIALVFLVLNVRVLLANG
jgi:hypothetical protein